MCSLCQLPCIAVQEFTLGCTCKHTQNFRKKETMLVQWVFSPLCVQLDPLDLFDLFSGATSALAHGKDALKREWMASREIYGLFISSCSIQIMLAAILALKPAIQLQ